MIAINNIIVTFATLLLSKLYSYLDKNVGRDDLESRIKKIKIKRDKCLQAKNNIGLTALNNDVIRKHRLREIRKRLSNK